jgi:hypothetical protein
MGIFSIGKIGCKFQLFMLALLFMVSSDALAVEMIFEDFSDTSQLTLNADATTLSTSDGVVLRLAAATAWQGGSAFSSVPLNASNFSTFFTFRITDPGGPIFDCNTEPGADGLVFVVQSVSSSIGGAGGGIGYYGIPDSVGVEFDTWCNSATHDPSSNHLGIDTEGIVDHGLGSPHTATVSPNFDDGNLWYVWIDYDGTTLEVRISQNLIRPQMPHLSRTLNIPEVLGQTTGYVGFTSATGADWGNHDIISWRYKDAFGPYNVCECDLNTDGKCNGLDWLLFYPDWGRTDCNEPGVDCECDLNGDGRCDGQDWLIFYPDWGRTDCPIPEI